MKKHITTIIGAALLMCLTAVTLTACSAGANSPEAAAKKYMKAMSGLNMSKIADITGLTGGEKTEFIADMKKAMDRYKEEKRNEYNEMAAMYKSMRFVKYEGLEEGDTAAGNITFKYKEDGKGDFKEVTIFRSFVKIDGKWYVVDRFGF